MGATALARTFVTDSLPPASPSETCSHFGTAIMFSEKYLCIFSRQLKVNVYEAKWLWLFIFADNLQ